MRVTRDDIWKFGIAVNGQQERVAEGRIIAHSIAPQVLIEHADGSRSWHREDMVRVAADDEVLPMFETAWEQWRRLREALNAPTGEDT